jgi:hypothetical protein
LKNGPGGLKIIITPMKTPIRFLLILAGFASFAGAQSVYVSNFAELFTGDSGPSRSSSIIGVSFQNFGGSFLTGPASIELKSVTLANPYTDSLSGLSLELYTSSVSGTPQTLVASFGTGASDGTISALTNGIPSLFSAYSFSPISQVLLDGGTEYWWVARFSADGSFRMPLTSSPADYSAYGWKIGNKYIYSSTSPDAWNFGNYAVGFAVSGSPVPEPSTYAILSGLAALGSALWIKRSARARREIGS